MPADPLPPYPHPSGTTVGRGYAEHREAALALLNGRHRISRKAGQFLGQLVVDSSPMSEAQAEWLGTLLERADLPPLAEGGAT